MYRYVVQCRLGCTCIGFSKVWAMCGLVGLALPVGDHSTIQLGTGSAKGSKGGAGCAAHGFLGSFASPHIQLGRREQKRAMGVIAMLGWQWWDQLGLELPAE